MTSFSLISCTRGEPQTATRKGPSEPNSIQEVELTVSVRQVLAGQQPVEPVSISSSAMLIILVLTIVAVAAYRDSKIAVAVGAACAVGALLTVVMTA
ncbi:hypothetical protein HUT06_21275 [Actinomadura sp. NAK00032]|uniref:hypothetical protein n=1 Tax=Actinomadura sp. NAK00032 TaxID=2742128 RepID=UPI00158FCBF2|nr:hypothetical protein [Actinomadura sp. NAK00032]QKW36252.1 hypothetical protein HUT06_21275 [Actinomadura sp. NAK00032]